MLLKQILVATHNLGKIKEISSILSNLPVQILSLDDIGETSDIEENGKTFEENAIKKAKYFAEKTGYWTVADDSGLMIDALGGEPGVKTRRWPGYVATDEEIIPHCLEQMKDIPWEKRTAQFVCVAVLALPNGKTYITQGIVRGIIATKPRGKALPGLPFDLLFYYPPYKKTFGEVSLAEKQKVDHRSQAFKKLRTILEKLLKKDYDTPNDTSSI